jgi:membrane protein insertase Oxa1/YidC/SpoIIIJ
MLQVATVGFQCFICLTPHVSDFRLYVALGTLRYCSIILCMLQQAIQHCVNIAIVIYWCCNNVLGMLQLVALHVAIVVNMLHPRS